MTALASWSSFERVAGGFDAHPHRVRFAVHEAGHAVAAHYLRCGVPLDRTVWISERGGLAEIRPHKDGESPAAHVIATVAGAAAERQMVPDLAQSSPTDDELRDVLAYVRGVSFGATTLPAHPDYGDGPDDVLAILHIVQGAPWYGDEEVIGTYRHAERLAAGLMRKVGPQLEAVFVLLAEREKLTGREVRRVLRRYPNPLKADR